MIMRQTENKSQLEAEIELKKKKTAGKTRKVGESS